MGVPIQVIINQMINYPTIHGIKINNSNGNVSIPANTTFSLSFDGYFNDYNRIETGNLYILATFSGSPESCLPINRYETQIHYCKK